MNDRYLRAAKQQSVDKIPLWCMRQAGRYLPEYRAVKEQVGSFMKQCKTPEIAAEITMQPLRRYDLDAGIIFSDILTIPDAMGLGLDFLPGMGPQFECPVSNPENWSKVQHFDVEDRLGYVAQAIELVKEQIQVPLIGFSGAPVTLALYMLEGQSSKDYAIALDFRFRQPEKFATLINVLSDLVADYLIMQVKAGADALMIFDTWVTHLPTYDVDAYGINTIKSIIEKVRKHAPHVPITVYEKGICPSRVCQTGADVIGLDHHQSLAQASTMTKASLQGNLHPAIMRNPDAVFSHVETLFKNFPARTGHIFNLGHGVTPDVPVESVTALVEAVATFGKIKETA